jgi:WhiB family redox-sensing transcriptional regulator
MKKDGLIDKFDEPLPDTFTLGEYQRRQQAETAAASEQAAAGQAPARVLRAVLPVEAVIDSDWEDRAACKNMPADMFYPEDNGAEMEAAKAVCRVCPVREDCLEHSLATRDFEGVRGGLNQRERKRLAKARRPTATQSRSE